MFLEVGGQHLFADFMTAYKELRARRIVLHEVKDGSTRFMNV